MPWLFARKALESNDPAAQAVTFLPAPYAFIVWAPIYTGFLIFAVWQARARQAENPRVAAIRPWLTLTALLNAAWIGVVAAPPSRVDRADRLHDARRRHRHAPRGTHRQTR